MRALREHSAAKPGMRKILVGGMTSLQAAVLRLHTLDDRYEGTLVDGGRCVWLTDGRRIELQTVGTGFVANLSKEPDPAYPGKVQP